MDFKDHKDFFNTIGSQYLHPSQWGESIFPVSVEEMYLHFKARLMEELIVSLPNTGFTGTLKENPDTD